MESINISSPNDGLGDKVRDAFNKVNLNFTELDDGKEVKLLASDSTKYYRGDKSWQTLDKTAVGLNLVDNTADSNKPVSIPQQNALNLKLDLDLSTQSNANALTGTETLFINQGGLPRKTTINNIVGDFLLYSYSF